MGNADLAVRGFAVNYGRIKVANFLPPVTFKPQYWWTRYPLETTRMWNLIYLFSPASWMWTFLSIASIVISLKIACFFGTRLGLNLISDEITLFPFRYCKIFLKDVKLKQTATKITFNRHTNHHPKNRLIYSEM